ncbi:hypothetical protein WA026_008219 [Henosepilachna vigintioctopunctata]|uniref:Uncharacterized protein n=1 Tax=Henosepilachna vigintioctopunctata TaxID=420089 RepID=A0AAW1TPR3_9CUCU
MLRHAIEAHRLFVFNIPPTLWAEVGELQGHSRRLRLVAAVLFFAVTQHNVPHFVGVDPHSLLFSIFFFRNLYESIVLLTIPLDPQNEQPMGQLYLLVVDETSPLLDFRQLSSNHSIREIVEKIPKNLQVVQLIFCPYQRQTKTRKFQASRAVFHHFSEKCSSFCWSRSSQSLAKCIRSSSFLLGATDVSLFRIFYFGF